jgi:hypothetical protein
LRKSIDQFAPDALRYFVDIRTVSYARVAPAQATLVPERLHAHDEM